MTRSNFPAPGRQRPPHGEAFQDPSLDSLLGHAKQTLTEAPRAEVAAAHVVQITEAARALGMRTGPRPVPVAPRRSPLRSLRRIAVTFAAALLAVSTSMAGLAYAGVRLPSAIQTAFRDVGIHLPNQSQGRAAVGTGTPSSSSQHGRDVSAVATSGPHGCVHGQTVSGVASANRQDTHAEAPGENVAHQTTDPCAQARHQIGGSDQSQSVPAGTGESGSATSGDTTRHGHGGGSGSGSTDTGTTHGQGKHTGADRGQGSAHAGSSNSNGSKGDGRAGKSGHD